MLCPRFYFEMLLGAQISRLQQGQIVECWERNNYHSQDIWCKSLLRIGLSSWSS